MTRFAWITCSLLLAFLAGCTGSREASEARFADDPSVVAVIDGQPFTVDEFEERYARSVGSRELAEDDSLSEYQDFLKRYVDFRLKVKAARAAGYEDDPDLQSEIHDYRVNLGKPYLMEEEVLEPIIRDLYEKSKEMIAVRHLLVRVEPGAAPSDTLAAYQRIAALRDTVMQGTPFADVAREHSEDPSAQQEGRPGFEGYLGYLGPGRVIASFEDMMYETAEGEVSPIFRTQYGYHILQVDDRTATPPDIEVSHILIRPSADTDSARADALEQLHRVQAELEAGTSFADLARQYSQDPGSRDRGGALGRISFDSRLVEPFKEAAFALDSTGAVSDIVETQYGYHLIKLDDRHPQPSYDEAYEDLKKRAEQLPRTQAAENRIVEQAFEKRGARLDTALVRQVFADVPVDSLVTRLRSGRLGGYSDSTFAVLGDSVFTFADLSAFASAQRVPNRGTTLERVLPLTERFMHDQALTYEALALEETNAEFGTVMGDFREGLLLFRVMEDSVWTAAAEDSVGLRNYYEAHRDRYHFPDRHRIVTLSGRSESELDSLAALLDDGTGLAALVESVQMDTALAVHVDTTFLAGPTDSVYDEALNVEAGSYAGPVRHQRRYMLMANTGIDPARPKTFEEARSEVATEYQDIVEQKFLEELHRRYDVQIYPERLAAAFGDADASAAGSVSTAAE